MNTTNLRDIKIMRLECHWSQDQLAEMSGLSIRTIQRIENGENTGLESLKYLAGVFEVNIAYSDKKYEMKQIRKEEEYVQNLKGLYKLISIVLLSLLVPFILAVNDTSLWIVFFEFYFLGEFYLEFILLIYLIFLEKSGSKKWLTRILKISNRFQLRITAVNDKRRSDEGVLTSYLLLWLVF